MTLLQDAGITRKPPFFDSLRTNEWQPRFSYEPSLDRTADLINRPHEDYPLRITPTKHSILETEDQLRRDPRITSDLLRRIHRTVFPDHGNRAGEWRRSNVRVGSHLAPRWEWIPSIMEELEFLYLELEIDQQNLKHWYADFETIHPFVDGNGRTGGIVIAAMTQLKLGIHLAPGQ